MIKSGFLFSILLVASISSAKESAASLEKAINQNLETSAQLEVEKDQLSQKISDLEKKIHERKGLLLKRSSALSYLKNYQFGALIARSQNPSQLDRNIKIFERLNQYDLGLFKDYNASLKMLGVTKKNLDSTLKELAESIEALKAKQQRLAIEESTRLSEVKNKNIPSLLKAKGTLTRPLEGSIEWPFGSKLDSSKQFAFVSKGLLFKTIPGSEVKSVGPGVIIFSDVVPPWRETLIIQHDDNYYSVYTGIRDPVLKVNDSVESNQILGNASSDEFYFELRHFENPINPKAWFKETL
jgi:septal ring factor EnvC (AmiA/AmiB activator)